MRKQYDFSKGVRGIHAARFREGVRIVVTDSESDCERKGAATSDTDAPGKLVKKRSIPESHARAKNS